MMLAADCAAAGMASWLMNRARAMAAVCMELRRATISGRVIHRERASSVMSRLAQICLSDREGSERSWMRSISGRLVSVGGLSGWLCETMAPEYHTNTKRTIWFLDYF